MSRFTLSYGGIAIPEIGTRRSSPIKRADLDGNLDMKDLRPFATKRASHSLSWRRTWLDERIPDHAPN